MTIEFQIVIVFIVIFFPPPSPPPLPHNRHLIILHPSQHHILLPLFLLPIRHPSSFHTWTVFRGCQRLTPSYVHPRGSFYGLPILRRQNPADYSIIASIIMAQVTEAIANERLSAECTWTGDHTCSFCIENYTAECNRRLCLSVSSQQHSRYNM